MTRGSGSVSLSDGGLVRDGRIRQRLALAGVVLGRGELVCVDCDASIRKAKLSSIFLVRAS